MDLTKQRKLELFGHICRMGTIMQSDQDRDSETVGGDRGRLVWLEIDVGYAERYTKHGRKNNIRWLDGPMEYGLARLLTARSDTTGERQTKVMKNQ